MNKLKIIHLNGTNVIKCPHCNVSLKVEELIEDCEEVADVVVCNCSSCYEEIIIKKEEE